MNSITASAARAPLRSESALATSAGAWLLVALLSQIFFIITFGQAFIDALIGGEITNLRMAIVLGFISKLMFATHVLLLILLVLSRVLIISTAAMSDPREGLLRFVDLGIRAYVLVALLAGVSAILMNLANHSSQAMFWGNSLNAFCIILFASLTWMFALDNNYAQCQRWILRTFIAVSGLWFARLGFSAWLFIDSDHVSSGVSVFSGAFNIMLATAYTLVPLALLEFYFMARDSHNSKHKWVAAIVIAALGLCISIGSFKASVFLA